MVSNLLPVTVLLFFKPAYLEWRVLWNYQKNNNIFFLGFYEPFYKSNNLFRATHNI